MLMMVKAAAEDTAVYTWRETRSCCTRTRGRSLAGPGPAGARIHYLSTHTFPCIMRRHGGGASP